MIRARGIIESALLTGLSVIFYIGADIPFLGALLMFLCPVPLVVLEMRHDLRLGFTSLIVGSLLVLLLSGPLSALSFTFGFAVSALAMGRIIETKRSAVEILLWSSLIALVCELILAVLAFLILGRNPMNMDIAEMEKMVEKVIDFIGASGDMAAMLRAQIHLLPQVIPSIFIFGAVSNSVLTYIATGLVVKKLNHMELPKLPVFQQWRFPISLAWAYVFSIALAIVIQLYPQQASFLNPVVINLQMILNVFFFVQGLSLLSWFLMHYMVAKPFRMLAVLVAFFALSSFVVMAGILDMCWNFRSRF